MNKDNHKSEVEIITDMLDKITEDKQIHFTIKPEAIIKELRQIQADIKWELDNILEEQNSRLEKLQECAHPCLFDIIEEDSNSFCGEDCENIYFASLVLFGSEHAIKKNGVTRSEVQELIKEERRKKEKKDPRIVELKAEIKKYNDLIQQIVLKCIQ